MTTLDRPLGEKVRVTTLFQSGAIDFGKNITELTQIPNRCDEASQIREGEPELARNITIDTICKALNSEEPPSYNEEEVRSICLNVLRNPDRLFDVRAMLSSVLHKSETGNRISPLRFTNLGLCPGWLPFARMPHEQTVRNFIDGSNKPNQPEVIAAYLFGLSVLKRHEHPVFSELIPQALVRRCEPLATLEIALDVEPTGELKMKPAEIARMGQQYYHLIQRGNPGVSPNAFDKLLMSHLFEGIEPATTDAELEKNERHLTAIRLGASGRTYVVSQLSISLIEVWEEEITRRYLYIRTHMASAGTEPMMRSHGFVIPAEKHTYLTQYHLDGQGFNMAAMANSDLHDIYYRKFRGMILALDKESDAGALWSKIVLLRANKPQQLIGNFDSRTLERKLEEDGCKVEFADIVDYLHNIGPVAVRSPAQGSDPNRYTLLSSWREILDCVSQDSVKESIDQMRPEEQVLIGDIQRPLRTE